MTHAALLLDQLAKALNDGDVLEVAALAGSLERFSAGLVPEPAAVRWADISVEEVMGAIEAAVDDLVDGQEDDEPEETWDALCALDELCAAATWLGFGPLAVNLVDLAVRTVRAFPEPWVAHSEAATALLATSAPLDDDPSGLLWRAVAGAGEAAAGLAAGL